MDAYLHLLRNRSNAQGTKIQFAQTMLYKGMNLNQHACGVHKNGKLNPFDDGCEMFFIPMHIIDDHWVLIVLRIPEKKIVYYDSLAFDGTQYLQRVKEWLGECAMALNVPDFSIDDWASEDLRATVPQQPNNTDCGVYTLMFADYLSDKLDLTFSQDAINFFRIKIAADIIRGRICNSE